VAIKEAIQTINRMQSDGVIERYAIGGAVGATFYLEPVATLDIDIFVEFPTEPGSRVVEGDYVVIGNWPVQFLPAGSPLLQEALATAVEKDVEDTPVRVFTPEHIVAIALETGRAKDKARVLQFIEANAVDLGRVREILMRHGLSGNWQQFEQQFLE
jgi:hypothetical protein